MGVDGGGDPNPDPNPGCQDDPTYRHLNKPLRTCNWIKVRKDQYCSDSAVSSACPVACDSCPSTCQDDPNYRYLNKPLRTCRWIKVRKDKYCSDSAVSSACPVAC